MLWVRPIGTRMDIEAALQVADDILAPGENAFSIPPDQWCDVLETLRDEIRRLRDLVPVEDGVEGDWGRETYQP